MYDFFISWLHCYSSNIQSRQAKQPNRIYVCTIHVTWYIIYFFRVQSMKFIYLALHIILNHTQLLFFFLFSGMSNVSACIMYARQQSVLKWVREKRITFMLMRWRLECMKMIVLNRRSAGKIAKFNSDCGQNWSCCFWMYRRS